MGFGSLEINMNTVVLKMTCDAGWTDAAGKFIARTVLVNLNLDTGLVRPHFEIDPEALNGLLAVRRLAPRSIAASPDAFALPHRVDSPADASARRQTPPSM
jgi:hypothetical protein